MPEPAEVAAAFQARLAELDQLESQARASTHGSTTAARHPSQPDLCLHGNTRVVALPRHGCRRFVSATPSLLRVRSLPRFPQASLQLAQGNERSRDVLLGRVHYYQQYKSHLARWVRADRAAGENVGGCGGCWNRSLLVPRVNFDNGRSEILFPALLSSEVVGCGVCNRLQVASCVRACGCRNARQTIAAMHTATRDLSRPQLSLQLSRIIPTPNSRACPGSTQAGVGRDDT